MDVHNRQLFINILYIHNIIKNKTNEQDTIFYNSIILL